MKKQQINANRPGHVDHAEVAARMLALQERVAMQEPCTTSMREEFGHFYGGGTISDRRSTQPNLPSINPLHAGTRTGRFSLLPSTANKPKRAP